jgi:drug/metabolite transporter (DMT)-like permease
MKIGYVVATAAAIMWGFVYAASEKLLDRMSPISAFATFYYAGAILLLPAIVTHREDMVNGIIAAPREYVFSVIGIMLAEFFIMWSIKLLGGTEAALVEVTYPLWTALFAFLLYQQRVSFSTIIGGSFIMFGLAVMSFFSTPK